ncbi:MULTISPECIES: sigma-70 family RNA polymerase sigma factor [Streptacidiphilus]|uniref:RNA polymerase sigma factor n=1 Tax=Streptacidiphilus cavernicola TaxID=3342716 RepID=A0ABV6UEQ8_9ACTN|nr:sigma-70 family RNA polymerase sigma factor [Streptacidiphilus jeojiense]
MAMVETMERSEDFVRLTDPFRRELLAHCYRMLGSVHDAEDLLQETMLRAWNSFGRFEGRSSLRTWLYRIATNACLRALEGRSRRPLPSGLGTSNSALDGPLRRPLPEVPWLQPIPDALIGFGPGGTDPADPAAVVASRAGVRLALVAALQYLPPRQRAVLILREVLDWRAAEVAELLGVSVFAVNSLLQRARAQIDQAALAEERVREPRDPRRRALLDSYAAAFEAGDMVAVSRLLARDVVLEMPPHPDWFSGRDAAVRFLSTRVLITSQRIRAVRTAANGQPALATYRLDPDGSLHAHSIQVLTLDQDGGAVTRINAFQDLSLFPVFGLERVRPAEERTSAGRGVAVDGPATGS